MKLNELITLKNNIGAYLFKNCSCIRIRNTYGRSFHDFNIAEYTNINNLIEDMALDEDFANLEVYGISNSLITKEDEASKCTICCIVIDTMTIKED